MNGARSIFDVLDPNTYGLQGTRHFDGSLIRRHAREPSRTLLIAASVSIAVVIFAGLFFYHARAQFATSRPSGGAVMEPSSGKVYLSSQAAAAASAVATDRRPPTLEMHIANNGLVLLEGARVTSLSGSRLRVEMAWGSGAFSWVVKTNSRTKFFAPNGEKIALEDIRVGDTLTVTGMLTEGGTEPTMDAAFVREE